MTKKEGLAIVKELKRYIRMLEFCAKDFDRYVDGVPNCGGNPFDFWNEAMAAIEIIAKEDSDE